jgi:hypothetical protein
MGKGRRVLHSRPKRGSSPPLLHFLTDPTDPPTLSRTGGGMTFPIGS